MRVLHLIDSGFRTGPTRGACSRAWADLAIASAAQLLDLPGHDQTVCFFGPRRALRCAAGAGLRIDVATAPALGVPRLPQRLAASLWNRHFDLVHCWSADAAAVAPDLAPAGRIVATLPAGAHASETAVLTFGPSAADRAALDAPASMIRIAPPPRIADPLRRAAVRRDLGLADSEVAILQVGAPPHADALRFSFMINLMGVAGCRAVGILPAYSAKQGRADRFVRTTARNRIIQTDRPVPDLLAAADLAVFDAGGQGPTASRQEAPWEAGWAVGFAHASGVPVVAPWWADDDGLYPAAAADLCLAHNSTLPEAARILMPLVEDVDRRAHATASLLPIAQSATAAFRAAVSDLWNQTAGLPSRASQEPVAACPT